MSKKNFRIKNKKRFITVIIILLSVITAVIAGGYYVPRILFPLDYYEEVKLEAARYNLDPLLVLAVIKAESNFQITATSHKDAKGLMQLQDKTATWCAEKMDFDDYSAEKIFDPPTNIKIGTWYLGSYLMNYYDNELDVVLAAYNAGTTNVDKWLGNPEYSDGVDLNVIPFKETENYVSKIKNYYEIYKWIY